MIKLVAQYKAEKEEISIDFEKLKGKREKDFEMSEVLMKEMKYIKLDNKKLSKQLREQFAKAKKATNLFKETLKVKLQYEGLIVQLNSRQEVRTII